MTTEADVLRAIQGLDTKLTNALNQQTEKLTRSIQELANKHNDAMLEQEKRNATFADRSRVEAVAEHGHATSNHVQSLALRAGQLEARITELNQSVEDMQTSLAERMNSLLQGTTGYVLTFLMLVCVAIISALLAHALSH